MRTYEIMSANSDWLIPSALAVGVVLIGWSLTTIVRLLRERADRGPTRTIETHDGPEAPF
jgi:hypothetical protein